METQLMWPFVVYSGAVLTVVVGMLGQRHRDRATDEPYESGITSIRLRLSAKYYLVAMLIYEWRQGSLDWGPTEPKRLPVDTEHSARRCPFSEI